MRERSRVFSFRMPLLSFLLSLARFCSSEFGSTLTRARLDLRKAICRHRCEDRRGRKREERGRRERENKKRKNGAKSLSSSTTSKKVAMSSTLDSRPLMSPSRPTTPASQRELDSDMLFEERTSTIQRRRRTKAFSFASHLAAAAGGAALLALALLSLQPPPPSPSSPPGTSGTRAARRRPATPGLHGAVRVSS